MRRKLLIGIISGLCCYGQLSAHCQMPCGIYHDEMVFDQIDQYIETMVKGISVMKASKFETIQDRNTFIRWVMQKETSSDEIAHLITTYFLQQKIKPNEEDTAKRVLSAHLLLFYLVQIKQMADYKVVNDFYEEWERFKLMFHIEGYKCKVNQAKLKAWAEKRAKKLEQAKDGQPVSTDDDDLIEEDHHHDHDHDHVH